MEPDLQVSVMHDFMMAIAPTVIRHRLEAAVYDEEGQLPTALAEQTAKVTLKIAMHLAAQYAQAYDTILETKTARIPVKETRKPDAGLQPAKGRVAPGS